MKTPNSAAEPSVCPSLCLCSRIVARWAMASLVARALMLLGVVFIPSRPVSAQWLTQTNALRPGWNAVYLHVDPSHTNVSGLVALSDPIEEIWLWNQDLPPSQALTSPESPVPGSQWTTWTRNLGPASELKVLPANSAVLVRVNEAATAGFNWRIKGRPATPVYRWSLSGLNLVGFPAVTTAPLPFFDNFLSRDAQELDWAQDAEIFRYQGGALGTTNPIVVPSIAYRLTPVRREQAYWVRSGAVYNHYFGPFQVSGVGSGGLRFDATISSYRLLLKNMSKTNLTVTLRAIGSETPPAGQASLGGGLPLVVRGALNPTNLTYGYTTLGTAGTSWTLTPNGAVGSEAEVVIGVNRGQLTGAPGTLYAGILQFTDSLGLTRVDLAASATAPSRTGLWVGGASVEYVSQYLKPYAKADSRSAFEAVLARLGLVQGPPESATAYHYEWDKVSGRILVFGGPDHRPGSYLLDGPIKLDSGAVPRPYPLRLIVHNCGTAATLLQRAYVGVGQSTSNLVVATREEALMTSQLASARRISATHLPTTEGNDRWSMTGSMSEGTNLVATVTLAHDDHASNPFLHTYHPDHDNLDAQFENPLPAGLESYGVRRVISLQFRAPEDSFDGLTRSAGAMNGNYAETLTFVDRNGDTKQFNALGTFTLKRVTDVPILTPQ